MQRTAPSGGHLPDEAGERGWPPSIYNVPSTTINWNRWDGYWEDHWEEIDVESLWKVLPTVLPYPASCKNLSIWLILLHWDFLTVSPLCPWSFVPPCSSLLLIPLTRVLEVVTKMFCLYYCTYWLIILSTYCTPSPTYGKSQGQWCLNDSLTHEE